MKAQTPPRLQMFPAGARIAACTHIAAAGGMG